MSKKHLPIVDPVRRIQHTKVSGAVQTMLAALGEDAKREGLRDTPNRVAKFYHEFLSPDEFHFTTFDADGTDEMVLETGIPFYSLCEHHLVPFFGTAAVAYVPGKKLVGLSKLIRTVQWYSRRFQNQERITRQIAERIQQELAPKGVGVILRGRHLCYEMRGVRAHDVWTTTSKLLGCFHEATCRAEFLSLSKDGLR